MLTNNSNSEMKPLRAVTCPREKLDGRQLFLSDGIYGARKRRATMNTLTTPKRYRRLRKQVDELGVFTVNDFEWIEELGKGQFGSIWKARVDTIPYDFVVAIKIINKNVIREREMTLQIERELRIHSALVHENICQYYGFFQNQDNIYIILEYCSGGNLFQLRKEKQYVFEEEEAANYAFQIARALRFIHAKNVLHRDLKPENILIDSEGRLKLTDFGWGVHDLKGTETLRCGTVDFMSPEVISNEKYREDADLWSLGTVIFEMLTGTPPFFREDDADDNEFKKTTQAIVEVDYEWPLWPDVSSEAKDLVDALLMPDVQDRLKLERFFVHEWIVKHVKYD